MSDEAAWTAAQKVEEWAGEIRVNLVRLGAVAVLYGHHLLNLYVFKAALLPKYHFAVTGIALAWSAAALALHIGLTRRWNPPALKYAAVACDVLLVTALAVLSDGPRSSFLPLYFLLIATVPLRLNLRLVWMATLLAIFSYAFLCGHARWVRPEWRVPRSQQVVFIISLACAGVLAGQAIRQARRLARLYGDRP